MKGERSKIRGAIFIKQESYMPLFEFTCHDCKYDAELLVKASDTPICPKCKSTHFVKKLSAFNAKPSYSSTSTTKARPYGAPSTSNTEHQHSGGCCGKDSIDSIVKKYDKANGF